MSKSKKKQPVTLPLCFVEATIAAKDRALYLQRVADSHDLTVLQRKVLKLKKVKVAS